MKNSIPGISCLSYSQFEESEVKKIERSCKVLVLTLEKDDAYKVPSSNKLKIITIGHNKNANEVVTFPPLTLSSLDELSQLVVEKHKVPFRGNNLQASDLLGDCIGDLKVTDILQFKLDEATGPELTSYIPQALIESTDSSTKNESTSTLALAKKIIISRDFHHLLVADAGTGKSWTLLDLGKKFEELLPNYWILRKDLSQCNKLQDLDLDNIKPLEALRHLFEDVLLELDSVQRRVLEVKVHSGKVVFLMDSLDAVWQRKFNMVLKLINAVCEKGILIVTTRTYQALEAAPKLKISKKYKLAGLDESELVSQEWKKEKLSKSNLEVQTFLKSLNPAIKSVPLHLLLCAKYFANHEVDQKFNLAALFQNYVENSLQNTENLVRGLLHKLSAYHLFEGENCENLSETELEMLRECSLVKILGKEASFKHRPVGEFLFATAAMRKTFKQPKPHETKFKQILLSPAHPMLRGFMNDLGNEGSAWLKCFEPAEKNSLMAVFLGEKQFNLMRIICLNEPVLPCVVEMLVESNSTVSCQNFSQFLDHLEEDGKVSDNDKSTALEIAFDAENVDLVGVLLERGADPNSFRRGENQDSYLHLACAAGNLALVKILAKVMGAEIVNKLGRTPLMQAVDNDWFETAKYLLEDIGVRSQVADNNGDTCLHLAARSSDNKLLRLFTERNLAVDALNFRRETALVCAAKCGRTANVEILQSHGASPDSRDKDGRTALDWAAENKHKEIVDILSP